MGKVKLEDELIAGEVMVKQTTVSMTLLIAVAALTTFGDQFDKFIYPPVIPLVVKDLGINFAQAGFLMSIIGIMGLLISVPGGMLVSKYGLRKVGVCALLVTALGSLLIVLSTSYSSIVFGRAIAGSAERVVQIVALSIVGLYITKEKNGLAQGILSAMIPISIAISNSTMGYMGSAYGWQSVFIVSIVLQVCLAIFLFIVLRKLQSPLTSIQETSPVQERHTSVWKNAGIWKLTLMWFLFQGSTYIITTWLPTILKERFLLGTGEAGLYVSLLFWLSVVSSLICGWISDKIGKRKRLIVTASFLMGIVSFLYSFQLPFAFMVGFMICTGLVQGFIVGPLLALVPEFVSKKQISIAFGVLSLGLSLALFIVPTLGGWIRDVTGTFNGVIYLLSGLLLCNGLIAATLKSR